MTQISKPVFAADTILDNRDNSFNLLRLFGAMLVLLSHESIVAGNAITAPGYFGVYVFFIISGFLITRSWEQRSSTVQYLKNRGLRILPGLFAVVLITTFVIGPFVTDLPVSRYFSEPGTWRYLLNLVFDFQRVLPGVFQSNPYHVVNTPLWTLPHEVLFYVVLAVLGLICREHLRYVLLFLYLIVLVQNDASLLQGSDNTDMPDDLLIYFFGGSLFWFFRKYIVFNKWLLVLALLALCLQVTLNLDNLLWSLCLPYVVLWLGLRKPLSVFSHFVRNDYSYGLYVWGMICQQCVVTFTGIRGAVPHMALSFIAVALCAYSSWHLLEKRALRARNR